MASYQLNEEVFVQDDGIWYPAAVTGCTYYSIRLSDKTLIDVPTYQMRMSATAVVHAKQVLETGTDVEAFAAGGDWQPASVVCGVLYTTSYGTTSVDCMRKAQNSTTTSSLFKRSFAGFNQEVGRITALRSTVSTCTAGGPAVPAEWTYEEMYDVACEKPASHIDQYNAASKQLPKGFELFDS
eukprot:19881-Heterococcus_DN1.PRE.1